MKPLRLTVSAFGPFAEEEEVNFEALGGDPLFLIHGSTGSGKSTLLDAMCYALYGQSLGGSRSGDQLRSDYAGPERLTRVAFEFAVGAERYRVIRTPKQERVSQRKKGAVTVAQPTAELHQITGDEELMASGKKNVDAAVIRILGFAVEDFRQVVMLPQGRFRELLSASSQERQKVLARIFDTARFRDLVERLKKAHSELKLEVQQGQLRITQLLETGKAESVDHLKERIKNGGAVCLELETALEVESVALKKAEDTLRASEQTQARFEALHLAQKRCERLSENEARLNALRAQLERGRNADTLQPLYDRADESKTQAEEAESTRLVSLQSFNVAESEWSKAESDRLAAEEQEGRVPGLMEEAHQLQAMEERIGHLEQLESEVKALAKAAEDSEQRHRVQAAQAEILKGEIEDLEHLSKALRTREEQQRQLRNQREEVQKASERVALDVQLEAGQSTLNEREAQADRAKATLLEFEQRQTTAQAAYLKDLSGGLAAQLKEGDPCSVCGSTEHPSPAKPSDSTPSKEAIEELRIEIQRCKKALDDARNALGEKAQELEGIKGRQSALPTFEGSLDALKAELTELEAKIGVVTDARTLEEVDAKLLETRNRLASTEAAALTAFGEARVSEQSFNTAKKSLLEGESALPEGFTSAAHVQARQAQLSRLLAAIEVESKRSREVHSACLVQRAEATKALELATKQSSEAREARSLKQAAFEQQVRDLGFSDAAAWVSSRLTGAEQDALEGRIQEGDTEKKAAGHALEEAREAVVGLEPVTDMEAQAARVAAARTARDAAIRRQAEYSKVLDQLKDLLQQITHWGDQNRELEERYATAAQLAETAKGKNGMRLDFERYVLGVMLDDVLQTAGARLQQMSRGRYTLHRAMDVVDGRKMGGLDLEVMDHWTGVARPVSTLSGGEGFMAALSLALGLADVIQAYSGGIRLDAVFVDEGFGSLDPEALEQAMRALEDLRAAGRMVGIISHVSELKARIDTRLELVQTRRGSRIRTVQS